MPTDQPAIEALIARSIRTLGAGDYPSATIELALKSAFGVDTQLIRDGTYFVVEDGGAMLACGGWSYRKTLFGNDARDGRDAADSTHRRCREDPRILRRSVRRTARDRHAAPRALRSRSDEARIPPAELMATLPGVRLYEVRGYRPGSDVLHPLSAETAIHFVPMSKELQPAGTE